MLYYDLIEEIKAGDIKPVYQISGEDRYWSAKAYRALLQLANEIDVQVFTSGDSISDAVTALNSFPMFSERKVVVIKDYAKFSDSDTRLIDAYITSPLSASLLIFYNCDTELKKAAGYKFAHLAENELLPYITSLVEDKGGRSDKAGLKLLVAYCEMDMARIENELIKLVAAGDISEATVQKYVTPSYSYKIYDFAEAISKGSYTGAYSVLTSMARTSSEYSAFFSNLTAFYRNMLHAKLASKVPVSELASYLKVSEYPLKKARRASGDYKVRELLAVTANLYRLEWEYKSGKITIDSAMDLAIAEAIERRKM